MKAQDLNKEDIESLFVKLSRGRYSEVFGTLRAMDIPTSEYQLYDDLRHEYLVGKADDSQYRERLKIFLQDVFANQHTKRDERKLPPQFLYIVLGVILGGSFVFAMFLYFQTLSLERRAQLRRIQEDQSVLWGNMGRKYRYLTGKDSMEVRAFAYVLEQDSDHIKKLLKTGNYNAETIHAQSQLLTKRLQERTALQARIFGKEYNLEKAHERIMVLQKRLQEPSFLALSEAEQAQKGLKIALLKEEIVLLRYQLFTNAYKGTKELFVLESRLGVKLEELEKLKRSRNRVN